MIYLGYEETVFHDGNEVVVNSGLEACNDLRSAKATMESISERGRCDKRHIDFVRGEFHDTETSRSWHVYGIGLSKRDYRYERTQDFVKRYK